MSRSWTQLIALVATLSGSACDESSRVIDPFPITMDRSAGPVLLRAQVDNDEPQDIVVDVLSPITVLDSYRSGAVQVPKREVVEVTLYGANDTVPRVRFPQTTAYDLHSCAPEEALCKAGDETSARDIFGILGADLLSRSSVRFDFPDNELRFFPDTAGTTSERTAACDAVFDSPFAGGGTLLIAGSEVRFGAWRPTLGVCLHHETIIPPSEVEESMPGTSVAEVGTDTQLAISTALGPTLLTAEAYLRYTADTELPAVEDLPVRTFHLPSGEVQGRLATIPFMALTGDVGADSDGRGPCRELYANARMRIFRSCENSAVDCPCSESRQSCKAAAAVELSHDIEVLIVDSGLPLLQALRDELRPAVPELDGVLGTQALEHLQAEFDFPNKRILMRCVDLQDCTTRPQVRSQTTLAGLDECREAEQVIRDELAQDAGIAP